jgi:hypothetical protein
MILRLLNWQGIAGVAATAGLAVLLLVQKGETNHWKKQSASFEKLYHQDQAAFATTVADYRAAADQARAADQANATRVAAEQLTINERIEHDFEARLAAARTDARRLRIETDAAADTGAGRSAPLPGLPTSPGGPSQATREDRLSRSDALTATEQSIQLDELIKWVRSQAAVDNDPEAVSSPPGD